MRHCLACHNLSSSLIEKASQYMFNTKGYLNYSTNIFFNKIFANHDLDKNYALNHLFVHQLKKPAIG